MKLQHNSSGESSEDLIALIIAVWREGGRGREKEREDKREGERKRGKTREREDEREGRQERGKTREKEREDERERGREGKKGMKRRRRRKKGNDVIEEPVHETDVAGVCVCVCACMCVYLIADNQTASCCTKRIHQYLRVSQTGAASVNAFATRRTRGRREERKKKERESVSLQWSEKSFFLFVLFFLLFFASDLTSWQANSEDAKHSSHFPPCLDWVPSTLRCGFAVRWGGCPLTLMPLGQREVCLASSVEKYL